MSQHHPTVVRSFSAQTVWFPIKLNPTLIGAAGVTGERAAQSHRHYTGWETMHVSKTDLQQSSLIDTSNLRESLCFPAGLSIQSALGLQRGAILMLTSNCVSVPSPDRSSHSAACTVGINRLSHLFFSNLENYFKPPEAFLFFVKNSFKMF